MAPGRDGESWHDMARSCPMLGKACGELSSAARHREAAQSRGVIGALVHVRRWWGVMAVGAGKWRWTSLLTCTEDKEGGAHMGR
jgi:hypothetical protein